MNFKRKLLLLFAVLTLFIPDIIYAYSDKVVLGGENIGISVNTKDILVVGFYKVNGQNIQSDSNIKIGDKITYVDKEKVTSIDEMTKLINKYIKDNKVDVTVDRSGKSINLKLNLLKDGNTYKTGLFIKDKITGIGTLTFIDPETNTYASLGHEIISSDTNEIININGGNIFKSIITGNTKSTNTSTGEKNAYFYKDDIYGTIEKNTNVGIYGKYNKKYNKDRLIDVADSNEVKLGSAKMYTVIDNDKIEEFDINIVSINKESTIKNILFEITDEKLLNITGGVIKGMSGSPIVQDGKLIGAVTHAIVNDKDRGYGIFITTMLENMEA